MIRKLNDNGIINDVEGYKKGIMTREERLLPDQAMAQLCLMQSDISVKEPAVVFAKAKKEQTLTLWDGQPVNLFFMIAAPEGKADVHLEVLATLARALVDKEITGAIEKC